MTPKELQTELEAGLLALGYKKFAHRKKANEISANEINKRYSLKLESFPSKQTTSSGSLGTYIFELEVSYKTKDESERMDQSNNFSDLVLEFFKRTRFPNFISLSGDPTFLDNESSGLKRAIGRFSIHYGYQGC